MSIKQISRKFSTATKMSTTSSPFSQAVVAAVRQLYPEKLADSSFDNTGLLLEAPYRKGHLKSSVLLTIDLTKEVAEEAIRRKDSIIIAYHPIIFRGLKSLSLDNSQQNSLLRLAQEGISVYSPHTAVDAAPGGLNDWLADIVTGTGHADGLSDPPSAHTREVIKPIPDLTGFEGAGYGKIVRFERAVRLGNLVDRICAGLGRLQGVSVATSQVLPSGMRSGIEINSIGICAGSGGSMLNELDVDMYFTGELSHHEALAAIEQDKVVVTAFHSNTERVFLRERMRQQLQMGIAEQLTLRTDVMDDVDDLPGTPGSFEVAVSDVDRDPYEIILAGQTGW